MTEHEPERDPEHEPEPERQLDREPEPERAPEPEAPPSPPALPAGRRGRPFKPLLATFLVAIAAFFTGLGLFNYVLMPRWVHFGHEVRVPDLANLNATQAERVLGQVGLRLSVRGEQYDAQVPKGFILWQDPPANDVVRHGRPVSVLVSLGEEYASLPVLYGESKRGASLLLSRSGLALGEIVEAYSDEVGPGLVVATEPGAQAVVARGTAVSLLVSRGSPADEYLMPDLRGRDLKSVRDDLEALGFTVQAVGEVGRLTSIVEQVPLPGTRIRRGQILVLKVAGQVIP